MSAPRVGNIAAILFDADGVIQRTRGQWRERFQQMLGREADLEAFVAEVFAAEKPCLTGAEDFPSRLAALLARWDSDATVEQALAVWTDIEVNHEMIDRIATLRLAGFACHLASNQFAHRARYMSTELDYRSVFDREFYSCRVGHAKPDEGYFEHILSELQLPGDRVVFIDDIEPNVAAARRVGLRAIHFPANAGAAALAAHLAAHGIAIE
jgi:putative hydrolase of the HAD superfamily